MIQEYLATGFVHVDGRDDASAYKKCLALLDSLPYFRAYKERSYELLDLSPGLSVLEAGCGLGGDVLRVAERLGPDGLVIGVDASARMIAEAVSRTPAGLPAVFAQADARSLPFRDGSFARCRIDRTLQHIAMPEAAVREMVRVLKPGGILLAYDNDWGTFCVSGSNDGCTRAVETFWEDSFTSRWVGRYLKRYFLEAGLADITVEPSVSVINDFGLADSVYNISQTAERVVDAGLIHPTAAEEWLAALQAQSRAGTFSCTLTAFTAVGTKPLP